MATVHCGCQVFTNICAIVFDKDGTIAKSEAFLLELAHRRVQLITAETPELQSDIQTALLRAFGVQLDRLDPAGLMAVGTRLENETAAAAYITATGKGWIESLKIVRSAFATADHMMPRKAEHTPLLSEAISFVQRCLQAKIRLAILSSDSAANVEDFVNQFELQHYFQAAYGVDQQYPSKAEPQLLQRMFAALSAQPEQTLMIGDSEADAELAANSGMAGCIGFTGGWQSTVTLLSATVLTDQFASIVVRS